jgi:hypothetical protein
MNLWRAIRRTGRVAEEAPPRPSGEAPSAARGLCGSVQVRHVDAGSCNGCEIEIGMAFSPVYDAERYGARLVASPRHADVVAVTGPVTRNMAEPLRRTVAATPRAAPGGGGRRLRQELRGVRRGIRRGGRGAGRGAGGRRGGRVPATAGGDRGGAADPDGPVVLMAAANGTTGKTGKTL